MCDISLMGTKIETKLYERELEEESGWTSYLETETDYVSNVSLFSESSTHICSNGSTKILNGMQKDNIGEDNYRLATCNTNSDDDDDDDEHKIVGQRRDGNIIEEGANYNIKGIRSEAADFPDHEELESSNYNYNCVPASSSTLSDASSFMSSSSPNIIISKKSCKRFYPKLHQISHPNLLKKSNPDINHYKRISHAAANYYLEDTATSSPSSALLHAGRTDQDNASSSSSTTFKVNDNERQDIFYEEGDIAVSTRFKALEALIPRLKEVAAGKGKEEEMVKVIERHVRHLELQVQLLSTLFVASSLSAFEVIGIDAHPC